ncbi:MAG: ACP S-malonyltransferase [Anaerolineae bacterium]|nr:ACP S-malonyltransferase [Anaerolineae bacterium]
MVDWSTAAWVFPGQGSQQVGMGADLVRQYPAARQVFEEADRILGFALSELCFVGPAEALDETINTQPALYVTGIATLRALESQCGTITPLAVAGHSLGEFTALTAAGALPFEAGVKLVRERGRLMKEAGEKSPGAMAALLGLSIEDARAVCEQATHEVGRPVVVANDNCPGQVVISGDEQALDRALELAKERRVKKAVKLAVSVAAHSPLMAHSAEAFRQALAAAPFEAPRVPIIGNVNAAPLRTREDIQAELAAQLTSSVRWTESVQALRALGVQTFVELGPKDVLVGLLKRINREATGVALNSAEAVLAV